MHLMHWIYEKYLFQRITFTILHYQSTVLYTLKQLMHGFIAILIADITFLILANSDTLSLAFVFFIKAVLALTESYFLVLLVSIIDILFF